ncbi:MAG: hypothetical protein WDN49_03745 [Acetobacteraceae bacterium]
MTFSIPRRTVLAGAAGLALTPRIARAQAKGLTYGISMADIPLTTGQPDRGAGA